MRGVYLDYNASTPLDPRVLQAMLPGLQRPGNASSVHAFGRQQAAAVHEAREHVAELVGGRPGDVILTAGATEANNLALRGVVEGAPEGRNRILVSAVEHASVLETAAWISDRGMAKVDTVPVTPSGFVDLDALDVLLGDDVLLVSVMAANSETGVLNPVRQLASRAHAAGALVHCDATQALGRVRFHLGHDGIDLVSLSGHKIYGPTGIGAIVATRAARRSLGPLIHGGGQEHGLRSGSINVAGAVGLGEAARIASLERDDDAARASCLRDRLVAGLLSRLPGIEENGDAVLRLPNTANIRFVGAEADAVLANMDSVAVSTGSACSAGSIEPSRVLLAMGRSREAAYESIRFSLGRFSTEADVDTAVDLTVTAVRYVRHMQQEGE